MLGRGLFDLLQTECGGCLQRPLLLLCIVTFKSQGNVFSRILQLKFKSCRFPLQKVVTDTSQSLVSQSGGGGGWGGLTKHGASQDQVINLVEAEFALLMTSLPGESNTNTKPFISFNSTGVAPSLRARRRLGPQTATLEWGCTPMRVFAPERLESVGNHHK